MNVTREQIGITSERYEVIVEQGHIRRFNQAIGDTNPIYSDNSVAEKSAYGTVIAPLTFPIALRDDAVQLPIKLDVRRMLHGEQSFIYHQPMRPGEVYSAQMKVADVYEKEGKSGTMQFIIIDTEFRNAQEELAVVSRMNIVYRSL
ncbi:MAG: MaoC family dehydratase N-terminal domain-containing protein [Bacillus sp. (in: firmicutes)]